VLKSLILRYFAGMTLPESCACMVISPMRREFGFGGVPVGLPMKERNEVPTELFIHLQARAVVGVPARVVLISSAYVQVGAL